jgi:uncharacterized membrane protein YgdD (TMEM256/DUF423 family)
MGVWLFLGGLNALLAVAAGAYGWHRLGGDAIFTMGSDYHMYHALALLAVAWLASTRSGRVALTVHLAGTAFMLGIILFSGTLYAFALTGVVPLAGAAPMGGALLMIGWLIIAALGLTAAVRRS